MTERRAQPRVACFSCARASRLLVLLPFSLLLCNRFGSLLQRFSAAIRKLREDRFRAVAIVRLAIFRECLFSLSFFFPYFWKFYEVFCFVVCLHWSDMSVHSSSLTRTVCLSHSFVLASLLLMTIWDCLIPITTFIGCRFASKKCAFTGETLCVSVVVCLTPSASFC